MIPIVLLAAVLTAATPAPRTAAIPRIVFAVRQLTSDGRVPGLGPGGRTLVNSGELCVREVDGRVHALLPNREFVDVADPAVSYDGRMIAFAAVREPGAHWRLWTVNADGNGLRPLTPGGGAVDDLDPTWLPDDRVLFASTRFEQLSQRGVLATNLFIIDPSGGPMQRITAERNGAEEPTIDPRTGRIVYARWWFNRWRPSDEGSGLTLDSARAVPVDAPDLWHAVSVQPDGDGVRLVGGDARVRAGQRFYQPIVLNDGTLVGVAPDSTSLLGATGALRIQTCRGLGPVRTITSARAAACAPMVLPDGRLIVSLDPTGGRAFGLWTMDVQGGHPQLVLGAQNEALLDAAVLASRPRPPMLRGRPESLPLTPLTRAESLHDFVHTFRFDCLNVFANGPVDAAMPDAPAPEPGVRIRFFATLARPKAPGGDTAVLVRDAAVMPDGAVHVEDMPADTPLFEQLVDAHGHVLRSASGAAHVAGLNVTRFGSGTKCVGCHTGHSTLPVPASAALGAWTNLAPGATVETSGIAANVANPRAIVDRRAIGTPARVAWIANSATAPWVRLAWPRAIEVRELVLYACGGDSAPPIARLDATDLTLLRDGKPVRTLALERPPAARGTHLACPPTVVDAVELRPRRWTPAKRAPALAEIEVVARLYPE